MMKLSYAMNMTAKKGLLVFKGALSSLQNRFLISDEAQGLFEFQDTKITAKTRQKNNDSAVLLMRELQDNPDRKATAEEKLVLSRYTGKGGNLEVEGVKGSQYEYYTPLPLANAMWALMNDLGFDGGAVLDPCAGTGIFSVGRPENTIMQSVELDGVSGSINGLVNDQESHNVIVSPFEAVASRTEDNSYDAVITNVPFGSKTARGSNARLDIYPDDDLDTYFVKRSIDKLKYGKLGVFLASTKLMTSTSSRKFRQQIALKAELIGAYRLPNKVFHPTGADVVTDIIVFRKYSQEMTEKLDNLYQNGKLDVLTESRVLDADIIAGKYFKTEGIKNVLGQSVMVTDWRNKQREIEAVVSDDSLANILKMIRRFPDSRINYEMLELTEELRTVVVQEGETRVMNGTTFEYFQGQWIPIKTDEGFDKAPNFETALYAFHSGMTLEDLKGFIAYSTSARVNTPTWVNQINDVVKNSESYAYWLVQFALYEALQTDITGKYSERYTALTSALKGIAPIVASKKYKSSALRTILNFNAKAFDGSDLSAYWYGTDIEVAQSLDAKSAYENAVYMGRSDNFMVPIDEIRQSDPDFDPLTNDQYAVNADGTKVTLNRDYYVGNYGELLARLESEIELATDPKLRAKLIEQRNKASEYIYEVDVNKINLSLRATNIDISIKSEFLSLYGGDDVFVNAENRVEVQSKVDKFDDVLSWIKGGDYQSKVRIYFLNRLLDSVNNNMRLTLRVSKDVNRADHDLVMAEFLKYVREIDATFLSYLQSNESFMNELDRKINDPFNKTMIAELDESPITVAGFNPKFETFKAMQTYQNAEVRRLSRRFEGIVGFDVGLGKTMTAIATVRNLINIGVKKRTMFVVPSHTISKWYRDTTMTLDDHSDVLVIGSKENSLESINSSNYGTDLNQLIKAKQWRIILITSDAFTMIPLKESTIDKFYESATAKYDLSKDKDRQAYNAFMSEKYASLQGQKGRLPYFEDLDVDSLVFDEAQMFKNGDASEGLGNFQTIRGLSLLGETQLSNRAVSAKVKSAYIRGMSALGDGVVLLSATPVTNSPAEIFTMLSLAVGDRKAKDILGGASIDTVDDFLSTFANTESIDGVDITGGLRSDETFTGFKNVELLKNALHTVANIQTARENDLQVPDQEDVPTNIDLAGDDSAVLSDLKRAYNIARKATKSGAYNGDPEDILFLEDVCARLGESAELVAHPFNLISKMQDLILMGKDAVMERGFYVKYIAPEDETLAQRVVDIFNKKPIKFLTKRNYPLVGKDDVKIKKRAQNFGDTDEYEITVRAFLDEDNTQLCLTANDMKSIASLFEIAEKNGLELKPKLSTKMQALVDNFKQELAMPMHNGHAKQIIFCDTLAMHHTIKQALIQYCGVNASRIAILNASIKPDGSSGKVGTDDVQEIQDGFSSDKFTVVIANKKADTGIDLQRGTQAIHHLTTGWTPDSLQQRNGRGVRQGNTQSKVRVYFYNANGTFDEYKLHVISGKSNWINALMNKDTATQGVLNVSSDMSDEELDLMIQADSHEAVAQMLIERETREKQARIQRATAKSEMMLKIARRSNNSADISLKQSTKDLIISDYKKYVSLMKLEHKTVKKEKLEDIMVQKQAIVSAYDSYIPNNSVANWNLGLFSYTQPRGGEPSYVSSLRTMPFGGEFKSETLVDNILNDDKGGIHNIAVNKYKSLQRMKQTTSEQFLNDADSPFSKDDRQMLLDGSAYVHSKSGEVKRNGDIIKHVNSDNGAVVYGLLSIKSLTVKAIYTNGNLYETGTVIEPSERGQAIQSFIDFEANKMIENEYFSYEKLTEDSRKQIAKFSEILTEVRTAVEKILSVREANWIDESKQYRVNTVRHKVTKNYYWLDSNFASFYSLNPELVQAMNAPFDGIITHISKEGLYKSVTIPNKQLHLVDITNPNKNESLLDDLYDTAEVHKIKLNFGDDNQQIVTDFWDLKVKNVREIFKQFSLESITLPYTYDKVLNDEQKIEILVYMLHTALGQFTDDVRPFLELGLKEYAYQEILKRFALDQSSPEATLKQHVRLHVGMGRYKNISLTGIAFLGNGSFGEAFKSTWKDAMKDYATSINKKCIWDSRETRWVVEPEVMLWMMNQDWFKLDEVDFF
jgi:superfamily II DNA or RNA helicase